MAWITFSRLATASKHDISLLADASSTVKSRLRYGDTLSNAMSNTGFASQTAQPSSGSNVIAFDAGTGAVVAVDVYEMANRARAVQKLMNAGETIAAAITSAGLRAF